MNKFIQWWESPSFGGVGDAVENVEYKHLLDYISHEKARGISTGVIHNNISSISRYFEFLNHTTAQNPLLGGRGANPARTLRLKGKAKKITQHPLKYEELEKFYQGYKELIKEPQTANINTPKHLQQRSILAQERNTIVVSLLIYQGLTSGELERLSVEDIHLTNGTIYIAGSAKSNSRTLQLNTSQILPLYSYIHGGTREKLIALPVVGLPSNYREEEHFKNSLLVGKMYGIVKSILETLRGINPQIKNAQHIRASVILNWLRQHNKRQVQYMAGHRYIDSTEKYAMQQMDTLTDALTKYHPFG